MNTCFPRPTLESPEVFERTAHMLVAYLQIDDNWAEDIAQALARTKQTDDFLSALTQQGWTVSDKMIEKCHGWRSFQALALESATIEWVRRHRVRPQCKIGQTHTFKVDGQERQVQIVAIDVLHGCYKATFLSTNNSKDFCTFPYEAAHNLAEPVDQFCLETTDQAYL